MRSDLALTPSKGVGIGERYFPEKPKIVPGVIRQGKNPIPLFRTLKPYGMFGGFAWGDLQIQPRRFFGVQEFTAHSSNTISVCEDSAELEAP